jgi:hypothetical protein
MHYRLVLSILFLLCVGRSAATLVELYEVTIVGNSTLGTDCANLGGTVGPTLMDTLQSFAPSLTSYAPPARRFLKVSSRKLSTKYCSSAYCSKSANYNWCYYNGCKCSCGHRRMLISTDVSAVDLQAASSLLNSTLALATATLPGCTLDVILTKITVDDSTL